MASNESIKEYMFDLLLANGFQVEEIIDFGKQIKRISTVYLVPQMTKKMI